MGYEMLESMKLSSGGRQDGYAIEETPSGQTLVVTGPWSSAAEELLRSGEVDGLVLNYARGFCESDLSFLNDWPLRRLDVLDRSLQDLEPIARLGQTLEELSVQAGPEARLDLGPLPRLVALAGEWRLIRSTVEMADGLRSLITHKFDESNLLPLVDKRLLKRLTIKDANRLETLQGISALSSLVVIGVHLARKLSDIADVAQASTHLGELRLEYCSLIDRLDSLAGLIQIRHLGVSECRQIESLAPLGGMAALETLHAWGSTRIVDGDLSPLLRLPSLREVRMKSRPEYRPSLEAVKSTLSMA